MERIKAITPPDSAAMKRAQDKWNSVAKPLHSLGQLEDIIIKIAGITGSESLSLDKRCVAVMCADHGVVEEGVTQSDSSVTAIVAKSVAEGSSNINLMARSCNADVFAYDVGMNRDVEANGLIRRKISYGSENIAKGAAMTYSQAQAALSVGMDAVRDLKEKGYKIIVTGEMGIGNTTPAAAVTSVITNALPEVVTGKGAGLDSKGLERKISAVKRALAVNRPDPADALDILSKIGGYDIGAMTGLFLGGAYYHVPIVADGMISAAAAALAIKFNKLSREYMLCSHTSSEPAAAMLLEYIGLKAPICAGLHLGEGTGGVLLLPLINAAMAVYNSSHLFEALSIEQYKEL
jgi:nicotinate-nucleotide--dimethylbenzimidazole phosphoribosyltransferase